MAVPELPFLRPGPNRIVAFIWGFLEGTIFFIVPDVYIGLAALFSLRAGAEALLWALLGSLASVVAVFALVWGFGPQIQSQLLFIPGINGHLTDLVQNALAQKGEIAVILGPWSGIPFKIYTVLAAVMHLPFLRFFLWSVPARLERTILVLITAGAAGAIWRRQIYAHRHAAVLVYLLLWVAIYIRYFAWAASF